MMITVQMTPEEYDAYREYQKAKIALTKAVNRRLDEVRAKHETLCKQILNGLCICGSSEHRTAEIVDVDTVVHVVEAAKDWFS